MPSMHRIVRSFWALSVSVAVVIGGLADRASADIVEVGTLGTVAMAANSTSGALVIDIFDSNPSVPVTVNFWQLALRIVPLGGATGTVTINGGSFNLPPNHIFSANPDQIVVTPNTPVTGAFNVNSNEDDFNGVLVPDQANKRPLTSLTVTASAGASGNFALTLADLGTFAAPSNNYWYNPVTDQETGFHVNGLPFFSGVSIGTIVVSAAPVPEPGSLFLAGTAIVIGGWQARRKRRSDAAAELPST